MADINDVTEYCKEMTEEYNQYLKLIKKIKDFAVHLSDHIGGRLTFYDYGSSNVWINNMVNEKARMRVVALVDKGYETNVPKEGGGYETKVWEDYDEMFDYTANWIERQPAGSNG